MRERSSFELSRIVSKYHGLDEDHFPGSLDDDFERALGLVTQKDLIRPLTRALAVAFRSPKTPEFAETVGKLYEGLRERNARRVLLKLLLTILPDSSKIIEEFGLIDIDSMEAKKISPGMVTMITSIIESSESRVVDEVSAFFARRPSLLVNLDTASRGIILSALGKLEAEGELGVKRGGDKVVTQQSVESGPPRRYGCVRIFNERFAGERGREISNDQPLRQDLWYQFEVSIRMERLGVPANDSVRPIREPKQNKAVDIIVTAEADGCEVKQPVSEIVLPPKGDSTKQGVFQVRPLRHSLSIDDLIGIRFKLFYRFNLLEQFTVRAEVVGRFEDGSRSKFGRAPAVELYYDSFRQSDLNDFDLITPACLHIHIEPNNDRYRVTFTVEHPELQDEAAFVANVCLTSAQLQQTISGARKTLFAICSSKMLSSSVDGSEEEFPVHLRNLAEKGNNLWGLLFDPSVGEGPAAIGKWLRENAPPDGSKIQVSVEGNASTFTFPWGLVYDWPYRKEGPHSERGFWGIRYVIEQRLAEGMRLANEAPPLARDEPEIGALFWKFAQAPGQQQFLKDLEAAKKIKLALKKPIDEQKDALDYLGGCFSQIIYFFTHGHTGLPDGEHFGVTIEDLIRLWERFPVAFRDDMKYVVESISSRQYRSDESFIELTSGRLMLNTLYAEVQTLHMRPMVILNMCDSAQVIPSLKQSFIELFLSRGARAVVGTECSMRPVFGDFIGQCLLKALFKGEPIGEALRVIRIEAVKRKNLLGLAYTLFGTADARLESNVSTSEESKRRVF